MTDSRTDYKESINYVAWTDYGKRKCYTCEYFHIRQEPIKGKGAIFDTGLASCEKHSMVVTFYNHGKLKRLECVEGGNEVDYAREVKLS